MSTSFTNFSGFSPGELPLPPKQRMGEDEFVAWVLQNGVRAEWADGEVLVMSPANREHSSLQIWILRLLSEYVEVKDLGTVLFDMLLRLTRRERYRIPDVFFVAKAREGIIAHTMLREPPDMVVEIVSPDSSARDWREKYLEYQEFGVREYWVIDPQAESFEIYHLDTTGEYQRVPVIDGVFHSTVVPGFWMRAEWFAPSHRPTVKAALQALGAL